MINKITVLVSLLSFEILFKLWFMLQILTMIEQSFFL
jgi:hypothetical protein